MQSLATDMREKFEVDAGKATVRIKVVDRPDIAVEIHARGRRFEEAADLATLVAGKLTVPAPADNGTATAVGPGDVYAAGRVFRGAGHVEIFNGGGQPPTVVGAVEDDAADDGLEVEISIPPEVETEIKTTGGDIAVLGPIPLKNAVLRSITGSVDVESVDGVVTITTKSGNISVGHGKDGGFGGQAVLKSSVGNLSVLVSCQEAKVRARSSYGDIEIAGNYDRLRMDAESEFGDVSYK